MTCPNMKELWEKYESGTATEDEQLLLETHMDDCVECSNYMNSLLEKEEHKEIQNTGNLFEEKDLKRTMFKAKWRQRFNYTMFLVALIAIVWFIGGILSYIYYTQERLDEIRNVQKFAIESMLPNVHVRGSGMEVKSYFRLNSEMRTVKQIGKENVPVGQFEFSHAFRKLVKSERNWVGGQYEEKLFFVSPEVDEKKQFEGWNNQFWEVLEKLPEGTVAEVALSFNQSFTIKEIDHLISRYFLDHQQLPVWYALDTGYKYKEEEGPYTNFSNLIGFPAHMTLGGNESSREEQVVSMLKLLSDNEDVVNDTGLSFGEIKLEEQYKYVKENGVKIYGVVLTGPTKSFLELKGLDEITFASLGEVELWNWFDRPASGERY